ncbi:hypothetical protein E2C01_036167 [Portunus trituberculatus]|uniref:Uncharacterized protein n=1 Tax=Portunus trituberculatus TaxID=210409 RepID=A0A5B7FBR2_PORTR|nr:hypothetical protein [Portunus trituberculatus]
MSLTLGSASLNILQESTLGRPHVEFGIRVLGMAARYSMQYQIKLLRGPELGDNKAFPDPKLSNICLRFNNIGYYFIPL